MTMNGIAFFIVMLLNHPSLFTPLPLPARAMSTRAIVSSGSRRWPVP